MNIKYFVKIGKIHSTGYTRLPANSPEDENLYGYETRLRVISHYGDLYCIIKWKHLH